MRTKPCFYSQTLKSFICIFKLDQNESHFMIKKLSFGVGILLALLLMSSVVVGQDDDYGDGVEILWDTWGVPHIFSPDNEGLYYGFGWAQAHNHGDLILRLYGQSRGLAAEYWGEEFLDTDVQVRTLGIPQEAQANYAGLPDEFVGFLDAFVAGINDFAEANPDHIDARWQAVLPITPIDVVAHGLRALKYSFVAGSGINYATRWDTAVEAGSNAWAIAPSRSASDNAMLVINPHQPWQDLGLWIEAHLVSPDVNLYGAALVANPVIGVGFNENLGWAMTVNTHDGWDLYELTLQDDGYVFDGEVMPFDVIDETIQILQDDGSFDAMTITVKRSVQGQVLAERDDGTALALRVVGENSSLAAVQWWEMGLANNFDEFMTAISDVRIPMFTIMYADNQGNIMNVFNEQVPIRDSGDWEFWNGTDIIDGTPSLIPGDTSEYVWTEYHPFEDLPVIINPDSGWLQNANEPPWTATLPLPFEFDQFPAYMLPDPYIWPRPITSMRMLAEDDSITYEELLEYKHSTFVELSRLILDDLLVAAQGVADETGDELLQRSIDVLSGWDGRTDADSVGAVLFIAWASAYIEPIGFDAFAVQWDINDPINTPDGLSDPDGAVATLQAVAGELDALSLLGIGIDVPYGDVFRLRVGEYDLPANGTEDLLGSFRILTFAQDDDLRFSPVHGDSFIAVLEFSDPIRAEVLLSYGNSTQEGSPHMGDQLVLFAEQELREPWLTREQIEANLEMLTTFE